MGLDIHIAAGNDKELRSTYFYGEQSEYFYKHSLSRTFCSLMCRQDVINHECELDQIERITGVNVYPIYEMQSYPEQQSLSFHLEMAKSEEERRIILENAAKQKAKLTGNIERVLKTVDALVSRLNSIDKLHELLLPTDIDTLDNKTYFADFTHDKGDGYIDNNFGQDLRNFQRFLEYAKLHGTTTVWFEFG